MDDEKRRIFLSQREVRDAGGPPVIGIRTEVQTIDLVVEETPESSSTATGRWRTGYRG